MNLPENIVNFLISRVTGKVAASTHFGGYRVYQDFRLFAEERFRILELFSSFRVAVIPPAKGPQKTVC
jgi:hypothetical protein